MLGLQGCLALFGVWRQAVLGQHLLNARGGVRVRGAVDSLTPDCVCVCVAGLVGRGGRCVRAGPEGSASPWFRGASRVTAGAWGLLGYGGLRGALNHYSCGPRFGNECSGRNQLLQPGQV